MKNNIAIGLLTIAVVILYILHFSSVKSAATVAETPQNDSLTAADTTIASDDSKKDSVENNTNDKEILYKGIAYVNMDTLLEKYKFAKEINARLLKKEKDAQAKLAAKEQQLRTDFAKVEEKYRKGLLTQTELQQESERFNKMQVELQQLSQTLTQNYINEQKKYSKQLNDTIVKFFKEYNANKHYEAILSNTGNDNILYAESQKNITSDVIDKLNKRYKK